MKFPERPTVHGTESPVSGYPAIWRPAREDAKWGVRETFRTCWYCGSIHPEDLIAALEAGAKLGGSDWKYGWPHKFYIDVPNPQANVDVQIGYDSKWTDKPCPNCCDATGAVLSPYADGKARCEKCFGHRREHLEIPIMGKRETIHAKWYNDHLEDEGFDDEARVKLLDLLAAHSGIRFEVAVVDGKRRIRYRAPYPGYQR